MVAAPPTAKSLVQMKTRRGRGTICRQLLQQPTALVSKYFYGSHGIPSIAPKRTPSDIELVEQNVDRESYMAAAYMTLNEMKVV